MATDKMRSCPQLLAHERPPRVQGRHRETVLASIRRGHTRFSQGYLVTRGVKPLFDKCLVPLTVRHLLVACPILGNLQNRDRSFFFSLALGKEALSP